MNINTVVSSIGLQLFREILIFKGERIPNSDYIKSRLEKEALKSSYKFSNSEIEKLISFVVFDIIDRITKDTSCNIGPVTGG